MGDMNLERVRFNMIEQQVRTWEVLDQGVLDAMLKLPREEFVPASARPLAFVDTEVPMGHGQVMLAPKLVGRLLQAVAVNPGDNVLEVGTGTGYVTALLAGMGRFVYSVEVVPELAEQARLNLARMGIENVALDVGDAARGWERRGSYDVIAITGSLPVLPEQFKKSLKIGGRLFAVVGEAPVMEAVLYTREGENDFRVQSLFETVVPPLVNAERPSAFKF